MQCFDGIHFKVLQEPLFFWSLFAIATVPCKRLQMQEKKINPIIITWEILVQKKNNVNFLKFTSVLEKRWKIKINLTGLIIDGHTVNTHFLFLSPSLAHLGSNLEGVSCPYSTFTAFCTAGSPWKHIDATRHYTTS